MAVEKRAHRNEQPGIDGTIVIAFDPDTGEVRIDCAGLWSVRQMTAFLEDWAQIVKLTHQAGRSVKAFMDMSRSGVQATAVTNLIDHGTPIAHRDGDAIALLMPNSVSKMRLRQVLDARYYNYFISRSAAETWLNARKGITLSRAAA